MPGCERHSLESMVAEAKDAWQYGVRSFVIFPKVEEKLKSNRGEEAYNPNGIVPRALKMLKTALPDSIVCTDVALDPYSSMGHDGIVEDGKILNDATIEQLCKQSVMQARAGSDIIAPSDMMDGRVGAIRDALDTEGFTDVSIMAYTAKYASAYYGPFRDALDSHPGFGDKKTYQQVPRPLAPSHPAPRRERSLPRPPSLSRRRVTDAARAPAHASYPRPPPRAPPQDPANGREALIEAQLDELEGADIMMVKPGLPYLDVIHRLKQACPAPRARPGALRRRRRRPHAARPALPHRTPLEPRAAPRSVRRTPTCRWRRITSRASIRCSRRPSSAAGSTRRRSRSRRSRAPALPLPRDGRGARRRCRREGRGCGLRALRARSAADLRRALSPRPVRYRAAGASAARAPTSS